MSYCPTSRSHNTIRICFAINLLLGLTLGITPAWAAPGAVFVVDTPTDSNDAAYQACTPAPDDCSLRGAISAANALAGADTITLPAGTYTLAIAGAGNEDNATGDLDVTSEIVIDGVGADIAIIQAGTDATNGVDRVFHVVNSSGNLTLNGVTLRYGRDNGGGVYNAGTLTVSNCVISDNTGTEGGGVYNAGALIINDCVVSDNTSARGGGVYNSQPHTVIIRNSILSGNTVTDYGGGIHNLYGTVTIENSTLSGNSSGITGGGLYSYGAVTIDHSTLSGNSASSQNGGGVAVRSDRVTITNSTLSNNSADGYGGGIHINTSTATVTLVHSTLTDNHASLGGGIYQVAGTIELKNSIVAGNTDNFSGSYGDCYGIDPFTSLDYNLVGSGAGCTLNGAHDQTTSDAKLGALADNGGPTQTHALLSGSPALNAVLYGFNGCGSDYSDDQRSFPRPLGGTCDIGAYEAGMVKFWDNDGGDGKWSTAANWSEDTLPTAAHAAVFNNTSDANATIDASYSIAEVLIGASYDGTISQGSNDLTLAGGWIQSGGTFIGGGGGLDLDGAFDLSAGSFTAPSGLMTVSGGFAHTGGTFDPNGGRVVLDNTSNQTLATTFHDLVINDGLLGYWKLDDGSGPVAADSSGYGHDGTLAYDTAWSNDIPNTQFNNAFALAFDGAGDSVNIAGTGDIDDLQAFTLAAWVKLNALPAHNMRIITLGNEKAVLRYDSQAPGQLHLYATIGGSQQEIRVNGALSTGVWLHVAGTYDGATLRLYLNGVAQGAPVSVSGMVTIGNGLELSSASETLDGLLDDVRVYNRALLLAEIQALAAGNHPGTSIATTTLGAALDVNGDLTLISGTLDVSASGCGGAACAINLAGDFVRNGGVFDAQTGVVTFDGSGPQTLDTDTTGFHDLTVNSGSTLVDLAEFSVGGTLTNNGALQRTQDVNGSTDVTFFDTGGHGGLILNANNADLGATTVKISGNQDCTSTVGDTVQRCFDITPTILSSRDATATFYFAEDELSGNVCSSLGAYHWNGATWNALTTGSHACSSEPYAVQATGLSDFSPFVLKSSAPCADAATPTSTAITVIHEDVTLSWDDNPANAGGYEVHRSTIPHFTPEAGTVHQTLVAGSTSFPDEGAAGSTGENYYYIVRGLSNCGAPSDYEKRLGEFDFGLVPGSE